MKETLRIKEAAAFSGLSADTLRYYEKIGLVKPQRSAGGYRCYAEEELQQLKYIAVMRYADFTVKEIKYFMDLLRQSPSAKCQQDTLRQFSAKKQAIRDKILFLQQIESLLTNIPAQVFTEAQKTAENQQLFDQYIEALFQRKLRRFEHENSEI